MTPEAYIGPAYLLASAAAASTSPPPSKRSNSWKERALLNSQKILHEDEALKKQFQLFLAAVKNEISSRENGYKQPICFISYAWPYDDYSFEYWTKPFIDQLAKDLRAAGIVVLIDEESSRFGEDSVQYMTDGIASCDTVLLIGTESFVAKSAIRTSNVSTEVNLIRAKIKRWDKEHLQKKSSSAITDLLQPLIPILISGTMDTALPADFQRRYVNEEWVTNEQPRIITVNYASCLRELLSAICLPSSKKPLKQRWQEAKFAVLPLNAGTLNESSTSLPIFHDAQTDTSSDESGFSDEITRALAIGCFVANEEVISAPESKDGDISQVNPAVTTTSLARYPSPSTDRPVTRFAIGNSDFLSVVKQNSLMVDKSLLLKDIIDDPTQVKLLIRFRRMGKTLNMSMMKYFFSNANTEFRNLFMNLKIWRVESERYQRECGKYPVLFISFKDIRARFFEEAYENFKVLISQLYIEHKKLIFAKVLHDNEDEKRNYQQIIDCKASNALMRMALKKLTEYLFRLYSVQVIVLIDEYDTPIHAGYAHKYYAEAVDLMRDLLAPVLKDNPYLHQAVLTGILRIAKESIFSGLNNIKVYSMLSDEFSEHFGFTEEEVRGLLRRIDAERLYEQVYEWYGGYQVGETMLFNPWSIINLINSLVAAPRPLRASRQFQRYWVNTSENSFIEELLYQLSPTAKFMFRSLMDNRAIIQEINEHTTFKELGKDPQHLWGFLLLSGYLTFMPEGTTSTSERFTACRLVVPNREIHGFYRSLMNRWGIYTHSQPFFKRVITFESVVDTSLLSRAQRLLDNVLKMTESVRNAINILVVGNTGAGKSSFINYVISHSVLEGRTSYPKIYLSDGGHSDTRYIESFKDEVSNVVYYDTPGLNDTRGGEVVEDTYISLQAMRGVILQQTLICIIRFDELFQGRSTNVRNLFREMERFGFDTGFQKVIIVVNNLPEQRVLPDDFQARVAGLIHQLIETEGTNSLLAKLLRVENIILVDIFDQGESAATIMQKLTAVQSPPVKELVEPTHRENRITTRYEQAISDALYQSTFLIMHFMECSQQIVSCCSELQALDERPPIDSAELMQQRKNAIRDLKDKIMQLRINYKKREEVIQSSLAIFKCLKMIITYLPLPLLATLAPQFSAQYELLLQTFPQFDPAEERALQASVRPAGLAQHLVRNSGVFTVPDRVPAAVAEPANLAAHETTQLSLEEEGFSLPCAVL